VDEADAEIARAQAALATAKSDLARRQEAVKQGAVSGEEAAHAADAIRTAQAGLALAQSHKANALSAVQGADVAHNPQVLAAIARVRRMAIAEAICGSPRRSMAWWRSARCSLASRSGQARR
jgi:membrane fusion protein (multidrug efflux system)